MTQSIEESAKLAVEHFERYLVAYEGAHGEALDDNAGVDACGAMLSAVAGVLVTQIGPFKALLVFGDMVKALAKHVPNARVDVVQCDKLPESPQEAMAMSLEREAKNGR